MNTYVELVRTSVLHSGQLCQAHLQPARLGSHRQGLGGLSTGFPLPVSPCSGYLNGGQAEVISSPPPSHSLPLQEVGCGFLYVIPHRQLEGGHAGWPTSPARALPPLGAALSKGARSGTKGGHPRHRPVRGSPTATPSPACWSPRASSGQGPLHGPLGSGNW